MSKLAYNLEEAAALCGVKRDTLDVAIRAGLLKAKAISYDKNDKPTRRVVLHTDLEAWLAGLGDA